MRTRLLNLLLLAALGLAVSRLWTLVREPPPVLPAIETVAAPAARGTAEGEEPGAPAQIRPESYDVIVARDVFSPARGVVPPAPTAAAATAVKTPPPRLTLYGVVILDGEKSAYLLEGAQEGRPRKVREGENFAGGTVKEIRSGGVTFLFAGGEIVVPLRTPKEGGGATQGQNSAAAVQRPEPPAALPRRLAQPGAQPAQMPLPGRQIPAAPGMRPADPSDQSVGVEEYFPQEPFGGGDEPDTTEEETQ